VWSPAFACPACEHPLGEAGPDCLVCVPCGRTYQRRDGLWRFLAAASADRLERFVAQYRTVRAAEGRRSIPAEQYRVLPNVGAHDQHAREWQIRRETYGHLLRHVLAAGQPSMAILDLGAGAGWLAHRLATLGHHVVAVDVMADAADGLGAVRHYTTPIVALVADFDALPLAPAQFDVVVFNGSLHYAPDVAGTLSRARRMLAPGGALVVMDSPTFQLDRDGAAMVADVGRSLAERHQLADVVWPGAGYLTFRSLEAIAAALQMRAEFVPSRGPIGWRLRRGLSRLARRRRPASFGLWVAR
jgi:SAM-dependent methyltransferase